MNLIKHFSPWTVSAFVFFYALFCSDFSGEWIGRGAVIGADGASLKPLLPDIPTTEDRQGKADRDARVVIRVAENAAEEKNGDDNDASFLETSTREFDSSVDVAADVLEARRRNKRKTAVERRTARAHNVDVGSTAYLNCSIPDAAVGEIKWRRLMTINSDEDVVDDDDDDDDDDEVDEDETEWDPRFAFKEKKGENVLVIRDVTLEDEATYKCRTRSASISFSLRVFDEPRITLKPKNRVMKKPGEAVTLECIATGKPKPQVVWARVGGRLDDSLVNGTSLVFKNVRRQDAGRYMCLAENDVADKRKGLVLVVGDIPGTINFTSPQSGSRATSYQLFFKVQSDAKLERGRLRLRQVHVQTGESLAEETVMFTPENGAQDGDNDEDGAANDADSNAAEIRRENVMLRNLKPSSKYEIRLQVKSKFGPSRVSSPFFFTTSASDFFVRATTPTPRYALAGLPVALGCDYAGAEPEAEFNDQLVVESVLWYFRPEVESSGPTADEGEMGEGLGDGEVGEEEEEDYEIGELDDKYAAVNGVRKASVEEADVNVEGREEEKNEERTESRDPRGVKVTGGSFKLVHRDYSKTTRATTTSPKNAKITEKLKKWRKKKQKTTSGKRIDAKKKKASKRANLLDGATATATAAEDAFLDSGDDEELETPAMPRRYLIAMRSRYPRHGYNEGEYRETVFSTIWRDRVHFRETFKPTCFPGDEGGSDEGGECPVAEESLGRAGLVVEDFFERHLGGSFECEVDLRFVPPAPQIKRDATVIRVVDAEKAPFMKPQISGIDGSWLHKGMLASLHCRVPDGADLPMKLEWRRDGDPIPSAWTWTNVSRSLSYSFAVDATDADVVYSCRVTHRLFGTGIAQLPPVQIFRAMGEIRLTSIVGQKKVDSSTGAEAGWVPGGADVQLHCAIDDAGSPPARLSLRRESTGAVLASTPKKEGVDVDRMREDDVQLLVNVSVSKRKQSNRFVCKAEQIAIDVSEDETKVLTSSSANLALDLAFGPSVGAISLDGTVNVTVGTEASFLCDAGEAAPRVEFRWTKNGARIEGEGSETSITVSKVGSRFLSELRFQALEADDDAEIVCTATNAATGVSDSSPVLILSASFDFRVFTDTSVVTVVVPEATSRSGGFGSGGIGSDVVLHCGAELPSSELVTPHLLTHTLSWYKIPSSSSSTNGESASTNVVAATNVKKTDLQLQVPDFTNVDDISFYVGGEKARSAKDRGYKKRRGAKKRGDENRETIGAERPGRIRRQGSSVASSSSSSSSSYPANVVKRYLSPFTDNHGHHNGAMTSRDSLILSYSRYPTLDFEKIDVKMDAGKFGLASDGASLTVADVGNDDFGLYVCQVDLHYVPIAPAPQNLHKAVTVELRKRINVYG